MQLFKRTPQEAFHNIENFDYKVHYISNLLSSSSEYKDFLSPDYNLGNIFHIVARYGFPLEVNFTDPKLTMWNC